MEGEVPQVDKQELACILVCALSAGKNVAAQRDRLLQLRRRLQHWSHGDEDAAEVQEEVASGLHKVYSKGLHYGARYLADCLETAAENRDRYSFSILAFAVIPDEQLYGLLRGQWHSPRPTTLVQAFARIESAYYAVMLPLEHHLPRCIELLVGVRPPSVNPQTIGVMIGYPDDLVAAANEHLRHLASRLESGFPNPDPDPAPAAATGKPRQAKSSVDVDHALTYLHRSCSLTSLAVKHLDVAIAFISSFLYPDEVAKISEWTDERTYYISEVRTVVLYTLPLLLPDLFIDVPP
ncbi:hypothetical protein ACQ4PT_059088 [Festuca glaucescens]